MCTHQMATLFCVKERHCRHLECDENYRSMKNMKNVTPAIDAYLREEQSWKFHLDPIFKPWRLELFEYGHFKNNSNNEMSISDMGSVPDPKMFHEEKLWADMEN